MFGFPPKDIPICVYVLYELCIPICTYNYLFGNKYHTLAFRCLILLSKCV